MPKKQTTYTLEEFTKLKEENDNRQYMRFSASYADTARACPASFELAETAYKLGFASPPSPWAEKGSKDHEILLEGHIQRLLNKEEISDVSEEHQPYLDMFMQYWSVHLQGHQILAYFIEEPIKFAYKYTKARNRKKVYTHSTPDLIVVSLSPEGDIVVHCIDIKTGYKRVPADTWQTRCYLSAYKAYEAKFNETHLGREVAVTGYPTLFKSAILQPTVNKEYAYAEYTPLDIWYAEDEMLSLGDKMTNDRISHFFIPIAGDHCKYCDGKVLCASYNKMARPVDLSLIDVSKKLPQLIRLKQKYGELVGRIKEIEEYYLNNPDLLEGLPVDVAVEVGKRSQSADLKKACIEYLKEAGHEPKVVEAMPFGVAKFEKLFGEDTTNKFWRRGAKKKLVVLEHPQIPIANAPIQINDKGE